VIRGEALKKEQSLWKEAKEMSESSDNPFIGD